jgi:transcriptional regulator with XRE-family HTH domain
MSIMGLTCRYGVAPPCVLNARPRVLTQADLASRLQISRDWVVRLERGHPRLEAQRVLDALVVLGALGTPRPKPHRARAGRSVCVPRAAVLTVTNRVLNIYLDGTLSDRPMTWWAGITPFL